MCVYTEREREKERERNEEYWNPYPIEEVKGSRAVMDRRLSSVAARSGLGTADGDRGGEREGGDLARKGGVEAKGKEDQEEEEKGEGGEREEEEKGRKGVEGRVETKGKEEEEEKEWGGGDKGAERNSRASHS